jgi:hypothetical protein
MQATTRIEQNKSDTRLRKAKTNQRNRWEEFQVPCIETKCKSGFQSTKKTTHVLVNANIVAREREMLLCTLMLQARWEATHQRGNENKQRQRGMPN